MHAYVANKVSLQAPFLAVLALACFLSCVLSFILLESFWVFVPCFIVVLAYSIFRWPVGVIAGALFLMPFLPLPLLALKLAKVPGIEVVSSLKEIGLLAAAIVLAWRQGFKLQKLDFALMVLLGWAVAISLVKPTLSTAIGLKDDFDFVLAFFVGRVIILSPRWIRVGIWIAAIVATLGLLEFFFLGIEPRMVLMGINNPAELPASLRADFFEGFRAGSTMGGPLEFGSFCAVVLLVFASFHRDLQKKYLLPALLIAMGLVASITRMAGLGLVLGLVVIAMRTGQKLKFAAVAAGSATLLLAVVVPAIGLGGFYNATLRGEDSSIGTHRISLQEKSAFVLTHPLGSGAGTVGPRANDRDPNTVHVESAYFQFGLEYGWLGLLLFAVFCGWTFFKLMKIDSVIGIAACAVTIAMLSMFAFSPIHMEFGLNSWAWVIIGSALRPSNLSSTLRKSRMYLSAVRAG